MSYQWTLFPFKLSFTCRYTTTSDLKDSCVVSTFWWLIIGNTASILHKNNIIDLSTLSNIIQFKLWFIKIYMLCVDFLQLFKILFVGG